MPKTNKRKSTTSVSKTRGEKKVKKSRRQAQIDEDNNDESLNLHRLGPAVSRPRGFGGLSHCKASTIRSHVERWLSLRKCFECFLQASESARRDQILKFRVSLNEHGHEFALRYDSLSTSSRLIQNRTDQSRADTATR